MWYVTCVCKLCQRVSESSHGRRGGVEGNLFLGQGMEDKKIKIRMEANILEENFYILWVCFCPVGVSLCPVGMSLCPVSVSLCPVGVTLSY